MTRPITIIKTANGNFRIHSDKGYGYATRKTVAGAVRKARVDLGNRSVNVMQADMHGRLTVIEQF